ncbi:hypothetical protein D9757_009982 [Collybiopsis confluens]|uniref:Neutral trehalase Ca2+ binding domain-containing protein n=1 Tax=Collybiopsis confluens TaxID=2823264 RepID=A0A8H5LVU6_9AGAR|nr:hypothetical protein D9757_009982 [Collybiopsis confluens]
MGHNNTSPKQCSICGKLFAPNGFKRHQQSCQNRVNEEESAARYHARLNHSNYIETAHEPQRVLEALEAIDQSTYFATQTRAGNKDLYPEYPDFHEDEQSLAEYDHTPDECELQPNDIKIEYHPASGKPATIMRFQEYGEQRTHDSGSEDVPDPTPWKPWRSRVDFEVAALALDSELFMSEDQTNILIDFLNRVACGRVNFTLVDNKETQKLWDLAAEQTVKFQQTEISVKYRNEEPEIYGLYYRPFTRSRTYTSQIHGHNPRRNPVLNVDAGRSKGRRLSHDKKASQPRRFLIDVEETIRLVLEQEDTDGNFQISVTDAGPKVMALGTATSNGFKTFDI